MLSLKWSLSSPVSESALCCKLFLCVSKAAVHLREWVEEDCVQYFLCCVQSRSFSRGVRMEEGDHLLPLRKSDCLPLYLVNFRWTTQTRKKVEPWQFYGPGFNEKYLLSSAQRLEWWRDYGVGNREAAPSPWGPGRTHFVHWLAKFVCACAHAWASMPRPRVCMGIYAYQWRGC